MIESGVALFYPLVVLHGISRLAFAFQQRRAILNSELKFLFRRHDEGFAICAREQRVGTGIIAELFFVRIQLE